MKKRNSKMIIVIALVIIVIGLSIGFAAMQTLLAVNGTGEVPGGNSWKMVFNLRNVSYTGTAFEGNIYADNGTIRIENFELKKPGDSIKYLIAVQNDGTFAAKLDNYTLGSLACDDQDFCNNNIVYKLGWSSDGNSIDIPLSNTATFSPGDVRALLLIIEYDSDSTESAHTSMNLTDIEFNFIQE